jgi:triosephosphate isomerase
MRERVIAGNWKMYRGGAAGCTLAEELVRACGDVATPRVVVAPPFTALAAVASCIQGSRIELSAQNLHPKPEGAFTGEIGAPMLLEAGCRWVIVGHSERRQFLGETDESVGKKVRAVLALDSLGVIACVGESLAEREAGQTFAVVDRHLDGVLTHVEAPQTERLVIAYEPVWAIGTGKTATPAQAQEVHAHIRQRLTERFGAATAATIRIQYGGSVKSGNAAALMAEPDIDGALVGGASLDAAEFSAIVEAARPR